MYHIKGIGTVAAGIIATGALKKGIILNIAPINISAECNSIQMYHQSIDSAQSGDGVAFNIKNIQFDSL